MDARADSWVCQIAEKGRLKGTLLHGQGDLRIREGKGPHKGLNL